MNKVYCKNCDRYQSWDVVGEIVEFCFVTVNDYHSKKHTAQKIPRITNATNKCKHYKEKRDKE